MLLVRNRLARILMIVIGTGALIRSCLHFAKPALVKLYLTFAPSVVFLSKYESSNLHFYLIYIY